MGGGEQYMFDTVVDLYGECEIVFWVYWDAVKPCSTPMLSLREEQSITFVEIYLGKFKRETLFYVLSWACPSVVHHQGNRRYDVARVCSALKIPCCSGVHFWMEVLDLHIQSFNQNIIENKFVHRPSVHLEALMEMALVYSPSPFVTEAVQAVADKTLSGIVFPISERDLTSTEEVFPKPEGWLVSQFSLHRLKGRDIFFAVAAAFPDVEFHGFDFHHCSTDVQHSANVVLRPFMTDTKPAFRASRVVLIPSMVDETFCKVAFEALEMGCIVVCSSQGNLPNIVTADSGGVVVESFLPEEWVQAMTMLLQETPEQLRTRAEQARARAEQLRSQNLGKMREVLYRTIQTSVRGSVMFLTVWGDQGLGIQSRLYLQVLEEHGFRCSVFSFRPYTKCNFKKTEEWEHPRVHYSCHTREQITDKEFLQALVKFQVGTVVVPEVCFHRVFELSQLARSKHVRVIAIPNIEICRRSELKKYSVFSKIISNNSLCTQTLAQYNIPVTETGFSFKPLNLESERPSSGPLRFLLVGGNNPFMRKNSHKILEAFEALSSEHQDWTLTITLNTDVCFTSSHPNVTILNQHLSYQKILQLFRTHHVYCQLTSNEGLGLNKYEAMLYDLLILTYDTEPYKDDLTHDENAHLIPAKKMPMFDNKDSIIPANTFLLSDLTNAIEELLQKKQQIFDFTKESNMELKQTRYKTFVSKFLFAVFS